MLKNKSIVKIFTGLTAMLLLIIHIPGCIENSATQNTPPLTGITTHPVNNPTVSISGDVIPDISHITPGGNDTKPINVTIHSAIKTTAAGRSIPKPGNIFIIINMTMENPADNAVPIDDSIVRITGDGPAGGPLNQKISDVLENPLAWNPIPPHATRTGEIIFGVNGSTSDFTLEFLDSRGNIVLQQEIGEIPASDYPQPSSPSDGLPAGLISNRNFSFVVENLDTPLKAAQYTQKKFIFESHGKCTSYSPEEFFTVARGDCKDYATFLSYLIAEHGYDAKVVAFKYYKGSNRNAHVVTMFTDTDGKMKYATTPDVTKFREVSSIDDLFDKECKRLGVNSVANYTVLPAGSVDACVL